MRIIAILFSLLLWGCASERAPLGSDPAVPHFEDGQLVTRDGLRLPLREWDGGTEPKAVIIGLHGMSDYSNAFAMPAEVWAKRGITTLAIDQRGFGRAPNPGLWAGSQVMQDDLNDFAIAARTRFPHARIYALGESMGGAVLLSALASSGPPDIDGAILISPAVWSRADMPIPYRVALFLVAHLTPGIILTNSAARHVVTITPSDNVPMLIKLAHDPLFQKKTRADTLSGLVNLMDEARRAAGEIEHAPPILFLHGAKDQVIPVRSADAAVRALGSHAEAHEYAHGYHMLLRDLEGAQVADDVADWVLKSERTKDLETARNRAEQSRSPAVISRVKVPENNMAKEKKNKRDLREGIPRTSITDSDSRMAGGADNPNVSTTDETPVHHPGVREKPASGETVKDS